MRLILLSNLECAKQPYVLLYKSLSDFYTATNTNFYDCKLEKELDETCNFKFTDLNCSSLISDNINNKGILVHSDYCSPEVVKQKVCNIKTELWAFGNLLFEFYNNVTQLNKKKDQTFNQFVEDYMDSDIKTMFNKKNLKKIEEIIDIIFDDNEKFRKIFKNFFEINENKRDYYSF